MSAAVLHMKPTALQVNTHAPPRSCTQTALADATGLCAVRFFPEVNPEPAYMRQQQLMQLTSATVSLMLLMPGQHPKQLGLLEHNSFWCRVAGDLPPLQRPRSARQLWTPRMCHGHRSHQAGSLGQRHCTCSPSQADDQRLVLCKAAESISYMLPPADPAQECKLLRSVCSPAIDVALQGAHALAACLQGVADSPRSSPIACPAGAPSRPGLELTVRDAHSRIDHVDRHPSACALSG